MSKKSKKSKNKKKRAYQNDHLSTPVIDPNNVWMDEEGLHFLTGGVQPSDEFNELLTREFQRRLKKSPFFDDIVKQFGKEEAEKLLKQCKVEPRGPYPPE